VTGSAWLIVGLGNPGRGYVGHRHNVGFLVIDELASRGGARFSGAPRLRADVAETRVGVLPGVRAVLAKPRTFMNDSGAAAANLLRYYSVEPAQLIVVHDEIDLPFETMRAKFGGGDNGHNGVKSIRVSVRTGDFYRVRIGIGRGGGRGEVADRVLSDFAKAERNVLPTVVDQAADAVSAIVTEGLNRTQQLYNS